jgi:hypothetical protein
MSSVVMQECEVSREPLPVCLWLENPYRLVSLQMIATGAGRLVSLWPKLQNLSLGFAMGGQHATTPEESRETLGHAIRLCKDLGWVDIKNQAARLLNRAERGEQGESMHVLADDLTAAFEEKVQALQIVMIEDRDVGIFTNTCFNLCGETLHSDMAIPEEELNLAGRALAFGLSTACVSHAMRSVEASLHVLTKSLNITFPAPVELQEWANLTQKLKSEISALERQSRSQQKTEQLKWLAELLLPADCFRLAWRNHVAHAREKYESEEARSVLNHTAEFLKALSRKI